MDDTKCPDCSKSIFYKGLLIVAEPHKCKRCQIQTCYFCAYTHERNKCMKLPINSGVFPLEKSVHMAENCCRCRYKRIRGTLIGDMVPEKCTYCQNDICVYCIKDLTEMKNHICAVQIRDEMSTMRCESYQVNE